MIEGAASHALLLRLMLADEAAGLFPRATVIASDGTVAAQVSLTPTAVPGVYHALWTPSQSGQFTIQYKVFSDAGFIVPAPYEVTAEEVRVWALEQDGSLRSLLGHAGENVRDDVLEYDLATGRPKTFRRRIFPDGATAAASTPGGTGEGEILTVAGAAQHLNTTQWASLVRVRA